MHHQMRLGIAGVACVLGAGCTAMGEETAIFRVAAGGGSAGGATYANIGAAVEAARRREGDTLVVIRIAPGEYYLEQPIELGPADSGLTIEAEEPGKAVLIGGRQISRWQPDGDRFWAADLPGVAEGQWDFRMLLVNGRVAPRARLPETGTFDHVTEFRVRWMSTTGGGWERKPTVEELTTMRYRPQDVGMWLDPRNAEVTVYHMWDESLVGVKANDYRTKTMTFAAPAGHPPGAFGVRKYVLWNVRQGMTRPGQWYLDRTRGKVVYWPPPEVLERGMEEAVVVAPTVQTLVAVRGSEGKAARGVTLRGLTLSVATTPPVSGGFGASALPGAVEVPHAEDCTLAGLEARQVGGYGIKTRNTARLRINRCNVHDTGAGGIVAHAAREATLADNRVHDSGRDYPSGIGLWINGEGCVVEHNAGYDTSYTAIAAGGNDHLIAGNLIHHPMQVLRDGAAIYSTFSKRITLRGNWVHDVAEVAPGYGASAYYLDEQAEDCVVDGNLAVSVTTPSHNHMARNNVLRGNVFVNDGALRLSFVCCEGYRLDGNTVVTGGELRLRGLEAVTGWTGNTLYSASGPAVAELLTDYQVREEKPLAMPAGNRTSDPGIAVEEGRVLRGGQVILDVGDAGPR